MTEKERIIKNLENAVRDLKEEQKNSSFTKGMEAREEETIYYFTLGTPNMVYCSTKIDEVFATVKKEDGKLSTIIIGYDTKNTPKSFKFDIVDKYDGFILRNKETLEKRQLTNKHTLKQIIIECLKYYEERFYHEFEDVVCWYKHKPLNEMGEE